MRAILQRKLTAPAFRSLVRQMALYGIVGGAQLLLDYATFVALTAAGIGIVPANLLARVAGAILGYFLNRHITFTSDASQVGGEAVMMARFVMVWFLLTVAGTFALGRLGSIVSLKWVWVAKPLTDGVLAVLGFLMSRYWIYK